jgi:hypothetical protein
LAYPHAIHHPAHAMHRPGDRFDGGPAGGIGYTAGQRDLTAYHRNAGP